MLLHSSARRAQSPRHKRLKLFAALTPLLPKPPLGSGMIMRNFDQKPGTPDMGAPIFTESELRRAMRRKK